MKHLLLIAALAASIFVVRAQLVVTPVTNTPPAVVSIPDIKLDAAKTQSAIGGLVAGVAPVVTFPSVNLFDGKPHDIHIRIKSDGSSVTAIQ